MHKIQLPDGLSHSQDLTNLRNFWDDGSHAHAKFNECQSNCVLTMNILASGLVLCLKQACKLIIPQLGWRHC